MRCVWEHSDVDLEIKCKITLVNRCCYSLSRQLISGDFSRATKFLLYKPLILPMLLNGAEALLSSDTAALRVFERKILWRIFSPVLARDNIRTRTNKRVNVQWLRWLDHVV